MPTAIDEERKSLGLASRTPGDLMAQVTGDQELFKYELITPHEPMAVAEFEYFYDAPDGNGGTVQKTGKYKKIVPKLVSTMALGNLNTKEVGLARIYTELSRIAARHNYTNIAISYYLKVVHLNVTSQSHQAQLLSQILSETVRVSRKEETWAGTNEAPEKPSKLQEVINKWKDSGTGGFSGNSGQQPWGLRTQ